MSSRTPVGEVRERAGSVRSPVVPQSSGSPRCGYATSTDVGVWLRRAGPGVVEAELALEERLAQRRPLGFRGAEPNMTVQELGEYWMRRRREEARAPSTGQRRGEEAGVVSLQTLAGYQNALSQIINPRLGGLRLTEARTGVVDEALTRVDLSGRTTRVARSVLAQMFAMAVRHDALVSNPMREVRPSPRRRRAVQALTVEQARDLLRADARPPGRCCSRRAWSVARWHPAYVRPARRGAPAAGHGDAHRRGAGPGVDRPRPGRQHPVRARGRPPWSSLAATRPPVRCS